MAAIQAFFRDDEHAHRCVSSPRNQWIEGYWSFHRRNSSTWWINFFQDLIHQNHLNTSSPLETECLWFCSQNYFNTIWIRHVNTETLIGFGSQNLIQSLGSQMLCIICPSFKEEQSKWHFQYLRGKFHTLSMIIWLKML